VNGSAGAHITRFGSSKAGHADDRPADQIGGSLRGRAKDCGLLFVTGFPVGLRLGWQSS